MKNNKINIGRIIYMTVAFVLALSFILVVLEKSQVTNFYSKPLTPESDIYEAEPKIDYSPASPTDNEDIDAKKTNGDLGNNLINNQKPDSTINVVLTAASQDNPGGPIVVRVLLSDVKGGQCEIKATKDTLIKTYSRKVVNAGTYYNCEALDIPTDDLSDGDWLISVNVTSDGRSGSAEQSVEVKL